MCRMEYGLIGPAAWFHVRVSQTEPILRVICEKRGEAPTALFESLLEHVRELRVDASRALAEDRRLRDSRGGRRIPNAGACLRLRSGVRHLCRPRRRDGGPRYARALGLMLQHAVQCGLLAAGCEVIDLGVLPTPSIQMYVGATSARGGIALTASHNPAEYNALKLFNGRGLFFNHYERGELIDLYHQSEFYQAGNEEIRSIRQDHESAQKLHIARVLQHVDVGLSCARVISESRWMQ